MSLGTFSEMSLDYFQRLQNADSSQSSAHIARFYNNVGKPFYDISVGLSTVLLGKGKAYQMRKFARIVATYVHYVEAYSISIAK